MFADEKTYEILQFLNSLIANDKTDDFRTLYMEALLELKNRTAIVASLYKYYDFDTLKFSVRMSSP